MKQQSEFQQLHVTCSKGRKKSRVQGALGFGFASHCWKNRDDIFKPITKCSNQNHVITFNGHLKTALIGYLSTKF